MSMFRFRRRTRCLDAFDESLHMLVTFGLVGEEIRAGSSHAPPTIAELFVRFVFFLSVVLS